MNRDLRYTDAREVKKYAKISFLRMNEIKQLKDEEELLSIGTTSILPEKRDITLSNIIFQYSPNSPVVLKNIFLTIPQDYSHCRRKWKWQINST